MMVVFLRQKLLLEIAYHMSNWNHILPSEESDRRKLDDYNALKEDLKKVWELLV